MSSADHTPRERPSDPPAAGRKRGRLLVFGVIVGVVVLVFAFMLVVSQCGGDSGSIYGRGAAVVGTVPVGSAV